jgi:hypothetical protein
MNKNQTIKLIYDTLMKKGTVSERGDIMAIDPMETKVYTKRLQVNEEVGSVELVYVTITSDDKDFMDASPNQVRINTKNAYDSWVNFWATEADDQILDTILSAILC